MEYTIKEVNVETGEEIMREATQAEIEHFEAIKAASAAEEVKAAEAAAAKAALLEKLNITEEEAKLLLS